MAGRAGGEADALRAEPRGQRPRRGGAVPRAVSPGALGATIADGGTTWRLWAPTARQVLLCDYPDARAKAQAALALVRDDATGVWTLSQPRDARGRYSAVDRVPDFSGWDLDLSKAPGAS